MVLISTFYTTKKLKTEKLMACEWTHLSSYLTAGNVPLKTKFNKLNFIACVADAGF